MDDHFPFHLLPQEDPDRHPLDAGGDCWCEPTVQWVPCQCGVLVAVYQHQGRLVAHGLLPSLERMTLLPDGT